MSRPHSARQPVKGSRGFRDRRCRGLSFPPDQRTGAAHGRFLRWGEHGVGGISDSLSCTFYRERRRESMFRPFRIVFAFAGGVLVLVVIGLFRERQGYLPFPTPDAVLLPDRQSTLPSHNRDRASPDLFSPWVPTERTNWDETGQQVGIELSRCKERGPVVAPCDFGHG